MTRSSSAGRRPARTSGHFSGPATNRSSRTTGIEIWRVENGKLAEHWDVVDVFGQLMQLGLIPQPTGSPA